MQKSLFPILILLLALLLPCVSSAAGKPTVVLMPIQVSDVDRNMISSMETALVEGLSEKYKVFSGEKVRAKAKEIFNKESKAAVHKDCDETRCMQDIAVAFQAELIAVAAVTKRSDGFFIALNIKNIFDDTVVFSKSIPCKSCDEYQVIDQLRIMAEGNTATAGFIASGASPSAPVGKSGIEEVRPTAETSQSSGPAGLYITTEPKGAEVYLGEIMAGNADPAFQKLNMEPGQTVRITLKKAEYRDTVFEARLKPGITKYEGIKLKPAFGYLTVNGKPDGAVVEIGGSQVGELPLKKLKLKSGKHLLTVHKELYETVSDRIIEVKDGEETTEAITLNEDFGTLNVSSSPTDAEVLVDGKEVGKTPLQGYRMSPGKYELTVTKGGYTEKKYTATVVKGKELTISSDKATLREKLFSAQIFSDPPEQGGRVYVDGVDKGEAPLTVDNLTEGTHKVEVKTKQKSGLAEVTGKDGESKMVEVKMAENEDVNVNAKYNADKEEKRKASLAAVEPEEEARSNRYGTVTDNATRLMWQQGEGGVMNWNSAIAYCNNLSLAGYNDWRLPDIKELKSIVDKKYTPKINKTNFPDALSSPYWSSTTSASLIDGALSGNFHYGSEGHDSKTNGNYVRCVRDGQDEERKAVLVDNATRLMWQQGEGGYMNWDAASAYCKNLSLAGHNDWRLPDIKELKSIIDVGKTPALNKNNFPVDYWLSTSGDIFQSNAWYTFFFGNSMSVIKTHSSPVRCVRGGQ